MIKFTKYYKKVAIEKPQELASMILAREKAMNLILANYYNERRALKEILFKAGNYKVYMELRKEG